MPSITKGRFAADLVWQDKQLKGNLKIRVTTPVMELPVIFSLNLRHRGAIRQSYHELGKQSKKEEGKKAGIERWIRTTTLLPKPVNQAGESTQLPNRPSPVEVTQGGQNCQKESAVI